MRKTAVILAALFAGCELGPAEPGPATLDRPVGYLVGAGDIAGCETSGAELTASVLDTLPGVVFTAGDNVQGDGGWTEWIGCYHPTWGRHRHRTRPAPGNHDYRADDGAPYYEYFGARAGPPGRGYYSYDVGGWLIISLNSNVDAGPGSPQFEWLTNTLAASDARCTLAYWHHPPFSSSPHATAKTRLLWKVLYDADADVVVVGHRHMYKRFAPMDGRGQRAPTDGMRQFTVGTGGAALHDNADVKRTVEFIQAEAVGVLQLVLYDDRYEWRYITARDGGVIDDGSTRCRP